MKCKRHCSCYTGSRPEDHYLAQPGMCCLCRARAPAREVLQTFELSEADCRVVSDALAYFNAIKVSMWGRRRLKRLNQLGLMFEAHAGSPSKE